MYGEFAQVYDRLMDDVDYDAWAAHYAHLMGLCARPVKRVAECACGTGSLTVRLARMGYEMTGLDLSQAMLERAAEKARHAGVRVTLARQDMRGLTLGRRVDAVLCTCDGVNYLTGEGDAAAFFRAAYAALRPGGGLFFDVSTAHKLRDVLGDAFFGEERDDVCYLWQSRYDAAARVAEMDVTFFVREADGRYRRFRELHRQRAYETEELEAALRAGGFCGVRIYGGQTLQAPCAQDERIHLAAFRPPETEEESV